MPLSILYGSTTGRSRHIAGEVQALLALGAASCRRISDPAVAELPASSACILVIPTWNSAQLQEHWQQFLAAAPADFWRRRDCALIGLGDQVGYPDSFADACGELHAQVLAGGGVCHGATSTTGYRFRRSRAVGADGRFVGLILDQETQAAQSPARLQNWLAGLPACFKSGRSLEAATAARGTPCLQAPPTHTRRQS